MINSFRCIVHASQLRSFLLITDSQDIKTMGHFVFNFTVFIQNNERLTLLWSWHTLRAQYNACQGFIIIDQNKMSSWHKVKCFTWRLDHLFLECDLQPLSQPGKLLHLNERDTNSIQLWATNYKPSMHCIMTWNSFKTNFFFATCCYRKYLYPPQGWLLEIPRGRGYQ